MLTFHATQHAKAPNTGPPACLCMQSYYDWMAWPLSGDDKLDARQVEEKGRVLDPQMRLFFSGEATHKDDAATVQGALLSGAAHSSSAGAVLLARCGCSYWLLVASKAQASAIAASHQLGVAALVSRSASAAGTCRIIGGSGLECCGAAAC